MLKYYSYYNVGGYKDMFLGTSSMKDDKVYFLPLLSIWKKKAQTGDKEMENRVQSCTDLQMIKIITNEENYGLPSSAKKLFSHGGYKIILTKGGKGETVFAIRDIETSSKDESGRSIPFLLVIVGISDTDKSALEKVATYASSHLDTFSNHVSSLFSYDTTKNGISFELASLTSYLNKISQQSNNSLLTMCGESNIDVNKYDVSLLVVPEGINKTLAIQELSLSGKNINSIDVLDIVPLDNQEKLLDYLRKSSRQAHRSIVSDKRVLFLLAGVALLGFTIGFIIAK